MRPTQAVSVDPHTAVGEHKANLTKPPNLETNIAFCFIPHAVAAEQMANDQTYTNKQKPPEADDKSVIVLRLLVVVWYGCDLRL